VRCPAPFSLTKSVLSLPQAVCVLSLVLVCRVPVFLSLHAFGNTAEHYRCLVYGCTGRGTQSQGLLQHATGVGWVAHHEGQYADALARKIEVCLVLVESLGGIYYSTKVQLYKLSECADAASAIDRTLYGRAAASPRSFCTASLPAHLPCSRYVGRRSHLQEGSDPQGGSLPSTLPPPYHLCYCRVGGPQRGHRQRAMPCSLFAH
jgi:hypothetical protein